MKARQPNTGAATRQLMVAVAAAVIGASNALLSAGVDAPHGARHPRSSATYAPAAHLGMFGAPIMRLHIPCLEGEPYV